MTPSDPLDSGYWPLPLRLSPGSVIVPVVLTVVAAWLIVVVVDLLSNPTNEASWRPMWQHLFNDRPIEWMQWFLLPATILTAAYLSARLDAVGERRIAAFFLLFSVATALMLIEDAGDIRHVLYSYASRRVNGDSIFGLPVRVVTDGPYLALLAIVPIYAILRYGRDVWRSPRTRPWLVLGFGLYALAGGSSGIRHLGDFYIRVGRWIDESTLGSRFPVPAGETQEIAHFLLVDSLIEESVETIAAGCFLAMVLAFAADFRAGRVPSSNALQARAAP